MSITQPVSKPITMESNPYVKDVKTTFAKNALCMRRGEFLEGENVPRSKSAFLQLFCPTTKKLIAIII